uniref:Putative secreted protein n=1 Tax=Anopheles triannulatus TaxID=58253 RepID=A0A2M4B7Q5_9DIPT
MGSTGVLQIASSLAAFVRSRSCCQEQSSSFFFGPSEWCFKCILVWLSATMRISCTHTHTRDSQLNVFSTRPATTTRSSSFVIVHHQL